MRGGSRVKRQAQMVIAIVTVLAAMALVSVGGQTGRSEAAPMPNGMISLTFDDGWASQISNARPAMLARGLKGTYALLAQALRENWQTTMTVAQVRQLQAEGNEIASHTVDHADLTTLSDAALATEIRDAKAYLASTFGATIPTFVTPYGRYNPKVLAEIRASHTWHRTVTPGLISTENFIDQLPSYDIHTGVSVASVKAIIDRARSEKKWGILTFHEIVDFGASTGTQLNKAEFVAILDYIKSTGIEVVTIDQGAKRMTGQRTNLDPGFTIFDDAFRNNIGDWSWAPHNAENAAPVRSGAVSYSVTFNAWNALRFHSFDAISLAGLGALEFWMHGGTTGGQNVNVVIRNGSTVVGQRTLSAALGAPLVANAWTKVTMSFAAMGIPAGASIDDLSFEESTGANLGQAFLDDIRFVPSTGTSPPTTTILAPTTTVAPVTTTTLAPTTTVAPTTTIAPTTTVPPVADAEFFIFDDAFRNGFENWSWAVTDAAATSPVKRGTNSVKITPAGWAAFYAHGPSTDGAKYNSVRFWIYAQPPGAQLLDVVSYSDTNQERGRVSINSILGGPLPAGVWREVVVPLTALNSATGPLTGLFIQDMTGGTQAPIWIDDMRLVEKGGTATTTTTTFAPTTTTTRPVTTTTGPPATTVTTTTTTTTTTIPPSGQFTLIAPTMAKAGVTFPLSVTGAIGGGRVDFVVAGIPVGTGQVDAAGRASVSATAWSTGSLKLEAFWVNYVGGVPTEKSASALITVS
jgi:peptidoglycan/xylan/chitin deacetylase (PgdA/CDA1 family)